MPRTPTCRTHGTRLVCPSCVAASQKGRPATEAQRAVRVKALEKARATRWPKPEEDA